MIKMNEKEKDEYMEDKNRSMFTLISYSVINFGSGTVSLFIMAYGLYFYEVEVGLPILLYTLAFVIFSIWDAINDPIIGFISDKPRKYTKRWGRRFPWIILGSIPISILFLFVFAPPDIDPVENALFIFFWLILFLCAYEWFYTAFSVNYSALYPQKFRTDRDRRYVTGMNLVVWTAMQFFGIVFPPLVIVFGDKSSFFTASLIIVLIALPFIVLGIPGVREDKKMIEQFLKSEEQHKEKVRFFDIMKKLLKNRNFLAILIVWAMLGAYMNITIASVIYYTRYILQIEEFWGSIILLGYLITGFLTIPFWLWVLGKVKEIKVLYIGMIGMAFSMVPILIFSNILISAFIASAVAGIFVCAVQVADEPLFASVIDQTVVQEKRRIEGAYNGILHVILNATAPLSIIIFAITHFITGFDPNADVQAPLAQWGIIADMALVPIILSVISILAFRLLWKLPEEKRIELRAQMREMDL